ncbi:hypothetical protein OH491_13515 [Termitidicoccus mucosus]|uniref:Uncharacterized protein n=1 Tax=Termitidicoccus mucosus TaxID=1184151 RepID=A0A178IJ82_9BACT|nr:hypothetical protein AW736_13935 [Opitutaceae bacterium TSB47]
MPDTYKKLSEIPVLLTPARDAHVVVVQGGVDQLVPLEAICDIDHALSDAAAAGAPIADLLAALDPQPPARTYKRIYNPARDRIEFWRRGDDGQWHKLI